MKILNKIALFSFVFLFSNILYCLAAHEDVAMLSEKLSTLQQKVMQNESGSITQGLSGIINGLKEVLQKQSDLIDGQQALSLGRKLDYLTNTIISQQVSFIFKRYQLQAIKDVLAEVLSLAVVTEDRDPGIAQIYSKLIEGDQLNPAMLLPEDTLLQKAVAKYHGSRMAFMCNNSACFITCFSGTTTRMV